MKKLFWVSVDNNILGNCRADEFWNPFEDLKSHDRGRDHGLCQPQVVR